MCRHECPSMGVTVRLIGVAVIAATIWLTPHGVPAAPSGACTVPDYLLSSDLRLRRVSAAVDKRKALRIAVVGTGSSALAGPEGPSTAYPARLEAALVARFPGVDVKVITLVRSRLTARDLARNMGRVIDDEKPDLVIW